MTRVCTSCWKPKEVSEFPFLKKGTQCSVCRHVERNRIAANKAARDGVSRAIYIRIRAYKTTVDTYLRLMKEQAGGCAICELPLCDDINFDHDHVTGRFRGLLCTACNSGLGQFKDDPTRLMRAAGYLQKSVAA